MVFRSYIMILIYLNALIAGCNVVILIDDFDIKCLITVAQKRMLVTLNITENITSFFNVTKQETT